MIIEKSTPQTSAAIAQCWQKKCIRNLLLKMGADRLVRLDGEMESAVESEIGSKPAISGQ